MEPIQATGSEVFDELLGGGYEKGIVTTIYGPAASGKTTACLLAAKEVAKNKKTIYIDTEGGFSINRLSQLSPNYKKVLNSILLLKPMTFAEQKKLFSKIRSLATEKIGLMVVDTVSMLYRQEIADKKPVQEINREMSLQISYLVELARAKEIPVIITNQVYSDFEDKTKVNIVGGDLLRYQSKCMIELQVMHNQIRKAILRKHRSRPEKESLFEIFNQGFKKVNQKRSIRSLF